MFCKKVFLEISQNLQENTCARISFRAKACNFIKKEALAQVFFCEFCEISKSTFFHRTPLVAAFERGRNISKTFAFIFHHGIQHDEASGYTFYNDIDCAN